MAKARLRRAIGFNVGRTATSQGHVIGRTEVVVGGRSTSGVRVKTRMRRVELLATKGEVQDGKDVLWACTSGQGRGQDGCEWNGEGSVASRESSCAYLCTCSAACAQV